MRGRILAVTAAVIVAGAAPLSAQRGPRAGIRGGAVGPAEGPGRMLERQVQGALDRRTDLGLSEAQVQQLESLRSDIESTFAPLREEMEALRSEARDRSGDRDEVRARMTELRDRQRALAARLDTLRSPLQARFEQAVPPLQRQQLQRGPRQGERRPQAVPGRRGAGGGVGVAPAFRRGVAPMQGRRMGVRSRNPVAPMAPRAGLWRGRWGTA